MIDVGGSTYLVRPSPPPSSAQMSEKQGQFPNFGIAIGGPLHRSWNWREAESCSQSYVKSASSKRKRHASTGSSCCKCGCTPCLRRATAANALSVVWQGVLYCHMKGLCHRDLKLENLLLDEKGEARAMASAVSCMRNG